MHKLRVIIPFRGQYDLFKQSVLSIVEQTSPDWELFIIDNSDYKKDVLQFLTQLHNEKISLIQNQHILSISENFQTALDLADNEWFIIFGADDVMDKNFIAECMKIIAEDPDVGFIHARVRIIDQDNRYLGANLPDLIKELINPVKKGSDHIVSPGQALRRLAIGNYFYFPAIVWRKSAVGHFKFRQDLQIALDLDLEISLLTHQHSYLQSSKPIVDYRRHSLSESTRSANRNKRLIEEKKFYKEFSRDCIKSKKYITALIAWLSPTVNAHLILHKLQLWRSN